jgi:hypothetical protein
MVPVALFVFNRPDFVRQVMVVLAQVRPPKLMVVADGPRDGVEADRPLCAEARRIANEVDWPCEIVNHWSESNLGCDDRMRSGLDWVFEQVDEAVILEDDIVPEPSFFSWCGRLLSRYRDDPAIALISGRNNLGRWGDPGRNDHLIARRGSIHGWATWASSWKCVDHHLPPADRNDLAQRIESLDLDPIVRENSSMVAEVAASGQLSAWDTRWSFTCLLADRWAVVPPVNMTMNIGFGELATRTTNANDFRARIPTFAAPDPTRNAARPDPDEKYDRRSLLAELMATYRQPEMAIRLARHRNLLINSDGSPDLSALVHLTPIDHLEESIEVLRHLRSVGTDSPSLDDILGTLEACAATEAGK